MSLETTTLVTALGRVSSSLREIQSEARVVQSEMAKTREEAGETERRVASATSGITRAAGDSRLALSRLGQQIPQQERELGEFITFLEGLAEQGNSTADLLLDQIADLQAGVITTQDILRTFAGDGGEIEGFKSNIKTISQAVTALLPTTSQVQSEFRRFIGDIKGRQDELDILVGRLTGSSSAVSLNIGNITQAILSGRASVEQLIEALSDLRDVDLAGSEGEVLGQRILELLRDGGLG